MLARCNNTTFAENNAKRLDKYNSAFCIIPRP
jgi:hypothetical protein